jgi:hypothetical protein
VITLIPVSIFVLAGATDLTKDVERPVGKDLNADLRVEQKFAVPEPGGDGLLKRARGQSAGLDLPGEREVAVAVEPEPAGQVRLLIHGHLHLIAGVEFVADVGVGGGSRRRLAGGGPGRARGKEASAKTSALNR